MRNKIRKAIGTGGDWTIEEVARETGAEWEELEEALRAGQRDGWLALLPIDDPIRRRRAGRGIEVGGDERHLVHLI